MAARPNISSILGIPAAAVTDITNKGRSDGVGLERRKEEEKEKSE